MSAATQGNIETTFFYADKPAQTLARRVRDNGQGKNQGKAQGKEIKRQYLSGHAVDLSADFSRLAMRAAKRVKSSKNKEKATHLVCSHLKNLLLQGLARSPRTATRAIGRPRRAVVHRVISSDASIHPITHQRFSVAPNLDPQIGLPI
ncbi:MAG: hypothetical protein VW683_16545 [Betaproteobacteria bacterium]|jgi:hypothetical protein